MEEAHDRRCTLLQLITWVSSCTSFSQGKKTAATTDPRT